jgi:hypothetical protein
MPKESDVKNAPKQDKVIARRRVLLIVAIFCYLISIFLPISFVLIAHIPLDRQCDAAVINGIITASAILFGFSALRKWRIESIYDALSLIIFFFQILILVVTSFLYFVGYLTLSYPPLSVMVGATTSLLVNLSSLLLTGVLTVLADNEDEDGKQRLD